MVFTHNIWFTTQLLSRFENTRDACSFFEIDEEGGDKGILRRANEPRTDSISNLRTRINKLVREAKNTSGEAREALVEKAYDVMRAFCERIVTEDFFSNVVQPYQPNVRMWNLPKIPTNRLGPAIAAIMPIYDKCCRQTAAHAQPLETLSIRASLTECETDWRGVQEIRERYLSGAD